MLFGNRITPVHNLETLFNSSDMLRHCKFVSLLDIATRHCLSMPELLFPTSVDPSIGGRPCLLNQNFSWYMHWFIVGWTTVNSVLTRLPWSLAQRLQSVLNFAVCLIFGLKRFDHITPALIEFVFSIIVLTLLFNLYRHIDMHIL